MHERPIARNESHSRHQGHRAFSLLARATPYVACLFLLTAQTSNCGKSFHKVTPPFVRVEVGQLRLGVRPFFVKGANHIFWRHIDEYIQDGASYEHANPYQVFHDFDPVGIESDIRYRPGTRRPGCGISMASGPSDRSERATRSPCRQTTTATALPRSPFGIRQPDCGTSGGWGLSGPTVPPGIFHWPAVGSSSTGRDRRCGPPQGPRMRAAAGRHRRLASSWQTRRAAVSWASLPTSATTARVTRAAFRAASL